MIESLGKNITFVYENTTRENDHINGRHCLWEYESFRISNIDEIRNLLDGSETLSIRVYERDHYDDVVIPEEQLFQMRTVFDFFAMQTGLKTIYEKTK